MSLFVVRNPDPAPRRGMPQALYVSTNFGRSDTPGYLNWTDRSARARKWKTRRGVERFMENNPWLAKRGYFVVEVEE